MKNFILLSLFGATLSACSYPLSLVSDPNSAPAGTGTFNASNIDPALQSAALKILDQNCTACHGQSSGPAGVYGLADVKHLFSSGLLVAGAPDKSPLFLSIQSGSMPPQGPLAAADQEVISNFIISAGSATGSPTGGDYQPAPAPQPEPTFAYIQKQILGPNCAGCHYQGSAKGGYAFDTYTATLKAVNKQAPAESVLYSITQSGAMPISPKSPLNSEQLNLILTWIEKGALNN